MVKEMHVPEKRPYGKTKDNIETGSVRGHEKAEDRGGKQRIE